MLRRALTLAFTLAVLNGCKPRDLVINDSLPDSGFADALATVSDAPATTDLASPKDAKSGFSGDRGNSCLGSKPIGSVVVQPVSLWLLLDRSAAMKAAFDGTTRGLAAANALTKIIDSYQYSVSFGFLQFPANPAEMTTACPQNTCCAGSMTPPVSVGPWVKDSISCGPAPATSCFSSNLDSPSYDALAKVYRTSGNQNAQYVLLVTASDPSCATNTGSSPPCDLATTATTNLVNDHVYVFMLPVGVSFAANSCMFKIGQQLGPGAQTRVKAISPTPATTQATLEKELDDFVSNVAQQACIISLDSRTPIPHDLNGVQISLDDDSPIEPNNTDGYMFTEYFSSITFYGWPCDRIKRAGVNKIIISRACSTCGGPNACDSSQP